MSMEKNLAAILERGRAQLDRMESDVERVMAMNASKERKYIKLVEIADAAAAVIAPSTPCREHCSNCCFQAVAITAREADRIGSYIGRAPVPQPTPDQLTGQGVVDLLQANVKKYSAKPCVFLEGDRCTIYHVRPLACRTNHNLMDNADNCDVTTGIKGVPMIDMGAVTGASVELDITRAFADIRDFFPKESHGS